MAADVDRTKKWVKAGDKQGIVVSLSVGLLDGRLGFGACGSGCM